MAKSSSIDQDAIIALISRSDQLIEAGTKIGVAYLGYKSINHWTGALTSLIALKLAQSGNVVAGAAGVGVLGVIGLTTIGGVKVVEKTKYDPTYVYPEGLSWQFCEFAKQYLGYKPAGCP